MKKRPLKEGGFVKGRDYYFDRKGNVIMTREFLLKKGFCCKRGCKNCPY